MAEVDTRVLPHAVQKALNVLGIAMPWDEIAKQMRNGQSGGAIAQHLAKDIASLKEDGVQVPSPLRRGGNRNGRHEPVSTARLAPISSKVSKAGANNLSQRAKDKQERKDFKKNPSKFIQRDDTPPPHPRKKGQYTLACAPFPRIMPVFAQRELRPYPPPFLVEPSDPANEDSQGPLFSGPSAPAVLRIPMPGPYRKPSGPEVSHPPPLRSSATAVNRPPTSPSAARQESPRVTAEEAHTSPDYEPAQETIDPSGAVSAQEVIHLSDSGTVEANTNPSNSESEHETTDPYLPKPTKGITNYSAHEPVHDSSSFFSELMEPSHAFEPSPLPDLSVETYFGGTSPWTQNNTSGNAYWHDVNGNNPYDFNGHTINPAAFLQDELSMMHHDLAASL